MCSQGYLTMSSGWQHKGQELLATKSSSCFGLSSCRQQTGFGVCGFWVLCTIQESVAIIEWSITLESCFLQSHKFETMVFLCWKHVCSFGELPHASPCMWCSLFATLLVWGDRVFHWQPLVFSECRSDCPDIKKTYLHFTAGVSALETVLFVISPCSSFNPSAAVFPTAFTHMHISCVICTDLICSVTNFCSFAWQRNTVML